MYLFNYASYYWNYPTHGIILGCIFLFFPLFGYHVMLDPAGDSKNAGRALATCYERSLTLQICEAIKEKIGNLYPTIKITITHKAGEFLTQEHRAQLANKSNANLFVHISCFEDTHIKPHIMCYYNACTDIPYQLKPHTFIPAHRAHETCFTKTKQYVEQFHAQLKNQHSVYTLLSPYTIPDARLKYLMIPSFTIEIGVSTAFPWTQCVDVLWHKCYMWYFTVRIF
jgi:hypothetical protein